MNHHHTLTIPLPGHWTPEQALAVWELLEILTEHIGHRYAIALRIPAKVTADSADRDRLAHR